MSQMSRESRALLTASRHGDSLSSTDKARIRSKLSQRIGAGVALGSAMTAGATAAEAAHRTWLVAIATFMPGTAKVLGIVALSGAAGVAALQVSNPFATSVGKPRPAMSSTVTKPPPDTTLGSVRMLAEPVGSVAPDSTDVEASPPSATLRARSRGLSATAPSQPETVATSTDDRLPAVVAMIRESRAALRRGDPAAALAALDRGGPVGQGSPLEQETMLARVAALCQKGDGTTARGVADQFLARFADSPLAPRIRNSCAFGATAPP
jgi:hypothetical protein